MPKNRPAPPVSPWTPVSTPAVPIQATVPRGRTALRVPKRRCGRRCGRRRRSMTRSAKVPAGSVSRRPYAIGVPPSRSNASRRASSRYGWETSGSGRPALRSIRSSGRAANTVPSGRLIRASRYGPARPQGPAEAEPVDGAGGGVDTEGGSVAFRCGAPFQHGHGPAGAAEPDRGGEPADTGSDDDGGAGGPRIGGGGALRGAVPGRAAAPAGPGPGTTDRAGLAALLAGLLRDAAGAGRPGSRTGPRRPAPSRSPGTVRSGTC